MNKKIILLLIIACITSAIAFRVLAGSAGGSTACGIEGCAAATITSTTASTQVINMSNMTLSTGTVNFTAFCGNNTATPCLNNTITIFNVCNATTDTWCEPSRTLEYLNQKINSSNVTWINRVVVTTGSPPIAAGIYYDNDWGFTSLFIAQYTGSGNNLAMSKLDVFIPWDTNTYAFYSGDNQIFAVGRYIFVLMVKNGFPGDISVVALKINNDGSIIEAGADSDISYSSWFGFADAVFDKGGDYIPFGINYDNDAFTGALRLDDGSGYPDFAATGKILFPGSQTYGSITKIMPIQNIATTTISGRDVGEIFITGTGFQGANGGERGPFAWVCYGNAGAISGINPVLNYESDNSNDIYVTDADWTYYNGNAVTITGRYDDTGTNRVVLMRINDAEEHNLLVNNAKYITGSTIVGDDVLITAKKNHDGEYLGWIDASDNKDRLFVLDSAGTIGNKYLITGTRNGEQPRVLIDQNPGVYASNIANGTRVVVLEGSNAVSAFEIYNMTVDSGAIISAVDNGGLTGDYIDFVLGGRSLDNLSIYLDFLNTSLALSAINPNGTMQFTVDKIVGIETMSPDINILNFQLRWQNFTGTFDTTMGTCVGCVF
ncbi:MAG: hypothetical protein QW666_03195, partial [Candidatus Woesearchaeota archaeon]